MKMMFIQEISVNISKKLRILFLFRLTCQGMMRKEPVADLAQTIFQ